MPQGGPFWTPIGGPVCTPIDTENDWKPSAKLLKITNEAAASAMRVQTRNGLHLYWRRPAAANIISANAVEPFIDVRALEGQGYLVLPGAKVAYADKEGVKRLYGYKITNLPDEVGELPPQIAEAILARLSATDPRDAVRCP